MKPHRVGPAHRRSCRIGTMFRKAFGLATFRQVLVWSSTRRLTLTHARTDGLYDENGCIDSTACTRELHEHTPARPHARTHARSARSAHPPVRTHAAHARTHALSLARPPARPGARPVAHTRPRTHAPPNSSSYSCSTSFACEKETASNNTHARMLDVEAVEAGVQGLTDRLDLLCHPGQATTTQRRSWVCRNTGVFSGPQ